MVSYKIVLIIGLIFSVIVIGGASYLIYQQFSEEPVMEPPLLPREDIIYFNNPAYENWTEEQARTHCESRSGTFNPCGSACLDLSAICIQVCAMRCEFGEINTSERSSVQDFEKNIEKNAIDISSWQTYRNEKYGFEVRYPPDWENIIGDRDTTEVFDIAYQVDKVQSFHGLGPSYPGEFFVKKIDKVELLPQERNSLPYSFYSFADSYIRDNLKPGADLSETKFQLSSRDAIRVDTIKFNNNPNVAFVPNVTVLINYSADSIIWIEGRYFSEYKYKVLGDINQILSTFKFIE